jgi:anti-anti-sigma factor
MSSQPHQSGLELEPVGDVAVVRFTQRSLLGAELIESIGEQLGHAVEDMGYRKLVLNFANVESMTTAMVGHIVGLQRKLQDCRGQLALCEINPFLLEIFKLLNLTKAFTIHPDEQTAINSFHGKL